MSRFIDRADICALRYRLILMTERNMRILELCLYYHTLVLQAFRQFSLRVLCKGPYNGMTRTDVKILT